MVYTSNPALNDIRGQSVDMSVLTLRTLTTSGGNCMRAVLDTLR